MKHGAHHYANKPFNLDEIALLVEKALETTRLRREVKALRQSQAQPYSVDRIVGASCAIVDVKALLQKVAATGIEAVELPATGIDLVQLERSLVVQALDRSAWNQTRAATMFGLNRDQTRYRIEKFKLEPRNSPARAASG
jgi:DNA-binding NtrC family response regulator